MPPLPRGSLFGRCSDSAKTSDQGRQVPQAGTLGRQTDRQGFRQVSTVTMRFVFQYPLSPQLTSEAHLQLLHTQYTLTAAQKNQGPPTPPAQVPALQRPTQRHRLQSSRGLSAAHSLRHRIDCGTEDIDCGTENIGSQDTGTDTFLVPGGREALRLHLGAFPPQQTFFTVPLVMSRQYRVSRQPVTTQPLEKYRTKVSTHTRRASHVDVSE